MIRLIIDFYIFILVADAILSYFPQARHHFLVIKIREAANLTLRPIRRYLPKDMPIDISPIIVILLLRIFVSLW